MTETQYPFFVYGTLRPGYHNYGRLLADSTVHIDYNVLLPGFVMLAGPKSPFPFLVPTRTGTETGVVGDLVYVTPTMYDTVLQEIDYLEGYVPESTDNLYERELIQFVSEGLTRSAYVYVASPGKREFLTEDKWPILPGGDWKTLHPLN